MRRHPPRPAAPHLRRQAAGGRTHPGRLQHPEGVHPAPGAAPAWWLLDDVPPTIWSLCLGQMLTHDVLENER